MANYKSNYTGAEIDSAVNKANSIPQPTSENVGKVLGVVEDENENPVLEFVEPSGGRSEIYVVHITYDKLTNYSVTESYADVLAACVAHKILYLYDENGGLMLPAAYDASASVVDIRAGWVMNPSLTILYRVYSNGTSLFAVVDEG